MLVSSNATSWPSALDYAEKLAVCPAATYVSTLLGTADEIEISTKSDADQVDRANAGEPIPAFKVRRLPATLATYVRISLPAKAPDLSHAFVPGPAAILREPFLWEKQDGQLIHHLLIPGLRQRIAIDIASRLGAIGLLSGCDLRIGQSTGLLSRMQYQAERHLAHFIEHYGVRMARAGGTLASEDESRPRVGVDEAATDFVGVLRSEGWADRPTEADLKCARDRVAPAYPASFAPAVGAFIRAAMDPDIQVPVRRGFAF